MVHWHIIDISWMNEWIWDDLKKKLREMWSLFLIVYFSITVCFLRYESLPLLLS